MITNLFRGLCEQESKFEPKKITQLHSLEENHFTLCIPPTQTSLSMRQCLYTLSNVDNWWAVIRWNSYRNPFWWSSSPRNLIVPPTAHQVAQVQWNRSAQSKSPSLAYPENWQSQGEPQISHNQFLQRTTSPNELNQNWYLEKMRVSNRMINYVLDTAHSYIYI